MNDANKSGHESGQLDVAYIQLWCELSLNFTHTCKHFLLLYYFTRNTNRSHIYMSFHMHLLSVMEKEKILHWSQLNWCPSEWMYIAQFCKSTYKNKFIAVFVKKYAALEPLLWRWREAHACSVRKSVKYVSSLSDTWNSSHTEDTCKTSLQCEVLCES